MRSSMFKLSVPVVLGGGVLFITAGALANDDGDGRRPLTVAVYGDAPYGTSPTDTTQTQATPAFIDSINADPDVVAGAARRRHPLGQAVLHRGLRSARSSICGRRSATRSIYTPGDNEWADCHKAARGRRRVQRGHRRRSTTCSTPAATRSTTRAAIRSRTSTSSARSSSREPGYTLGGSSKLVLSQAQTFTTARHPERREVRRERDVGAVDSVLFVTINLPGGSNNDHDIWYGAPTETPAQTQERRGAHRRRPALARHGVRAARRLGARRGRGHPGPGRHVGPEKGAAHQAGYEPFVAAASPRTRTALRQAGADAQRRLARLPLGQPARPRRDPLNYMHPGYDVPNFHRIVVHGSTFPLEWLRLTMNPEKQRGQRRERLRPVRVAGRAPVVGRRFAAAHALRAWRDLV